ncbi:hypothetical protein HYU14_06815 [Candidatus Woesearchaeota archaeon]|nr:hypothetical protein [Candidatus Woesearchaeota archaeon]
MATFLDISGLEGFSNIFAFLFVFLVVYGVLLWSKVFGGNKLLYLLLSIIIGLFTLFSPVAIGTISYIAPWVALIFIFVTFIMIGSTMFGGEGIESLGGAKTATFAILILVVFVGALSYIRDQVNVPGDEGEETDFTKATTVLLHPKVTGAIFVLLVAIFAVVLLAGGAYIGGGGHH